MARAKKEAALTPKERLQAALVPDWEWPYKLPENWCWTTCKRITSRISDGSHNPPKDSGQGIPLLSATNIHDGIIDFENVSRWITEKEWVAENSRTNIEFGDVLLTIVATLGRTAVVDTSEKFALQRSVAVLKPRINSKYLAYCLDMPYIQSFISDNAKGTAQKGFYLNSVENIYIPLAPLAEQQRIVDRIESLFAKLDEAKDKAQAVVDSFETRKAAILHKAFTGELTAKWREAHGVGMESWCKKEIGTFSFVTKLAGFEYTKNIAPNLVNEGIPLFKGKNVQKGELVLSFESYIPKSVSDQLPRSKLTKKCLLTPYVGTIGNIAIFDGSFEAHLGSNIGKIEIESDTYEEYLLYYLRSDFGYRELTKQKKATAQESISIQAIRETVVILASMDEQVETVRILDNLISKEQQAKEAAEAVLEKIDLMKKAILARAFRGELGTNDPNDESAVELLKKIL